MATVAIGDIHGNLLALEDVLRKVLPSLTSEDTLVFLGDYIDRGPDSRGCVDRIVRLKAEADFKIATLLGNHEDWMLRSLRNPRSHSWLLGMEAFETIASYSTEVAVAFRQEVENTGMALVTEKAPLPYRLFFDLLPPDHLRFFESLEICHPTEDVVCVHAGVDLNGCISPELNPEIFLWGMNGFPDLYQGKERVVYGHWNNAVEDERGWPLPRVMANGTYGIDTIARGVLTAMAFPGEQVFQSKRHSFRL